MTLSWTQYQKDVQKSNAWFFTKRMTDEIISSGTCLMNASYPKQLRSTVVEYSPLKTYEILMPYLSCFQYPIGNLILILIIVCRLTLLVSVTTIFGLIKVLGLIIGHSLNVLNLMISDFIQYQEDQRIFKELAVQKRRCDQLKLRLHKLDLEQKIEQQILKELANQKLKELADQKHQFELQLNKIGLEQKIKLEQARLKYLNRDLFKDKLDLALTRLELLILSK